MVRHIIDWNDDLIGDVVRRWNRGDSAATIGRALHLSREAVIGKIHRLRAAGVVVRDGDPKLTKVNYDFVRFSGHRQAFSLWSDEESEQLASMWNSGMGERELCAATGRSIAAIKSKLARLDDLGLIVRGAAREALKPKKERVVRIATPRLPKAPKERSDRSYGVKAISFPFKRDEARVNANTVAGLKLIARMESSAPGTGLPVESLRRNQCRWPTGGSTPQWLFCGNGIEEGVKSSYCATCRPRMYAGFSAAQQERAA